MGLGPVIPDEQHRARCLLRLRSGPSPNRRRRTWRPNGSVLTGTTSHRPSAPPHAPAGARSRSSPRRSALGPTVLTRRRLGHPILLDEPPDAPPLGSVDRAEGGSMADFLRVTVHDGVGWVEYDRPPVN